MGGQDPWRPAGGRRSGELDKVALERPADFRDGPILNVLKHSKPFDVLYLLHDPKLVANEALPAILGALAREHPHLRVEPRLIPIEDPREYETLYRHMRATCEEA